MGASAGTAHGEHIPDRIVHRNGYRDREGQSRVGTVALQKSKPRKGSSFPAFLDWPLRGEWPHVWLDVEGHGIPY